MTVVEAVRHLSQIPTTISPGQMLAAEKRVLLLVKVLSLLTCGSSGEFDFFSASSTLYRVGCDMSLFMFSV